MSLRRPIVRTRHLVLSAVRLPQPCAPLRRPFSNLAPSPSAPSFIPSPIHLHSASSSSPSPSQEFRSSTLILDGKVTADKICLDIRRIIDQCQQSAKSSSSSSPSRPGLAVIMAGDRRDSLRYVQRKTEKAQQVGFHSQLIRFSSHCTEEEVMQAVHQLNDDDAIHGILVQLPLPQHINQSRVLEAVRVDKDVDGFHPYNMGLLALNWKGAGAFVPWEKMQKGMQVSLSTPLHSSSPSFS